MKAESKLMPKKCHILSDLFTLIIVISILGNWLVISLILILFHVERKIYRPIRTNNIDISFGDTPGIRLACPIVSGLIRDNF